MTANHPVTTAREDAYRLLAACFYPPTQALLEENCCTALARLLTDIDPTAAGHAAHAATVAANLSADELAVEHARLFIGPFQLVAPPYGSLYLDNAKTVMGESTARVAAFYRSCGLHLADDFHELPDHIAVELECMSYLAFKQREAEAAGSADEARRYGELQHQFLSSFLLPWLEPFTSAAITDGEAPFYASIAHCCASFIDTDFKTLTTTLHG